MQPVVIAPSILSSDFARLADEAATMKTCHADWLHVDVMDGHFVPNLTIGPPIVKAIKAVADDGLIEAFTVDGASAFALAVQWHPEWLPGDESSRRLFRALVEAAGRR